METVASEGTEGSEGQGCANKPTHREDGGLLGPSAYGKQLPFCLGDRNRVKINI